MAMTGVRARRVDGAEVKLDTAFYRLRERFFGSRVGSLAFSAVAFNLGTNRGMVCGTVSWFHFGCVSGGGTGAFRSRVVERAFERAVRHVQRPSAICVRHTGRADPALLRAPPPARTSSRNDGG